MLEVSSSQWGAAVVIELCCHVALGTNKYWFWWRIFFSYLLFLKFIYYDQDRVKNKFIFCSISDVTMLLALKIEILEIT